MRGFLILLAAVLVAIGLGIAAEAVAGPSAYGPPGARFSADFPAAPSARAVVLDGHSGAARTYRASGHGESLLVNATTYPPSLSLARAYSSRLSLSLAIDYPGPGGRVVTRRLVLRATSVDGHAAASGVVCPPPGRAGRCVGVLEGPFIRAGGTIAGWSATATAPRAGAVWALLDSFIPRVG